MSNRGLYSKLLEVRSSKDLLELHWSGIHKCFGLIESISTDTAYVRQINTNGDENGFLTIPTSYITHIIENSQEINQIKQLLIQKSFKL